MKFKKIKRLAWHCGILFAVSSLQVIQAAPAENKPDVKKTSEHLKEVVKLLQQGEKSGAAPTDHPQQTQESEKAPKAQSK